MDITPIPPGIEIAHSAHNAPPNGHTAAHLNGHRGKTPIGDPDVPRFHAEVAGVERPTGAGDSDGSSGTAHAPGEATSPSSTTRTPSWIKDEQTGHNLACTLHHYITEKGGRYVQSQDGSLCVLLGERRIALDFDRNNTGLTRLFMEGLRLTTDSSAARKAIQRLRVMAEDKARAVVYKRFSGASEAHQRVYVPIGAQELLRISADAITRSQNGTNAEGLFVEHPYDNPLTYKPDHTAYGLERFEKLCVDTQACAIPEMRWFVACNEGLFSYVRDLFRARFITLHIGKSQSGKTTGARRFSLLHGLGDVKGDFTPAAYANLGDIGFLVMDNKEQVNLTQDLIDLLLFYSTGAERGRSTSEGRMRPRQQDRPVVVVTSIEGVPKEELKNRCVYVEYAVPTMKTDCEPIEAAIQAERDVIGSALLRVVQEYLRIRFLPVELPECPIPGFQAHFGALCRLLIAFGKVAEKPDRWALDIIDVWCEHVRPASREGDDSDALETLIDSFLDRVFDSHSGTPEGRVKHFPLEWRGQRGVLYRMTASTLLMGLAAQNGGLRVPLPQDEAALGRRLRSTTFRAFEFLDERFVSEVPQLRRQAASRYIGFFVPGAEPDSAA